MKKPNEKKQDLLLDALSCIDEDILAKSLAMRDAPKTEVRAANTQPSRTPEDMTPYLFDLSELNRKPPKKSPWRVISVVAAACLLLCVVPLSVWMAGRMASNAPTYDETLHDSMQNSQADIQDGNGMDTVPEESPDGPLHEPEQEEPNAPTDTEPPREEAIESSREEPTTPPDNDMECVTEPGTDFTPHEMIWEPAPDEDSIADYTAQAHNGAHVELVATFNNSTGESVSAEDERALLMVSQWLLSLYALDYGDHFPLFYESFVQERFIKEAVDYGRNYTGAIDRMDSAAANLFPVDNVLLTLMLEENTLLAGEELAAYLATKPAYETDRGFYPEQITAVRRVVVSGGLNIDGFHPLDAVEEILSEAFYLYEYEGKWYLDETFMDDDLSLDLLGTGKANSGFYKMNTTEGRVVAVDDTYLYLDTGHAFRIDGASIQVQTDNGEWDDTEIYVGDTVSVEHYSFELERLTRTMDGTENDEWRLSTADRVKIIG